MYAYAPFSFMSAYAGVYLSQMSVVYDNNSAIQITEIGETNPVEL